MGPRPTMAASVNSKILVVGQAPGRVVHETGIPWNDKSGDNLRNWLGVSRDEFYNAEIFAIVPMGFCYPGTGKSGDLPPRPECAPQWHGPLLKMMPQIQLTLLIGQYAQGYYLGEKAKPSLTETVKAFKEFLPAYLPQPFLHGKHLIIKSDITRQKAGVFAVGKPFYRPIQQAVISRCGGYQPVAGGYGKRHYRE